MNLHDLNSKRGFDPRSVSSSEAPTFQWKGASAASLQIVVERVGACNDDLPYELFNPLFGIHNVENPSFFKTPAPSNADIQPISNAGGLTEFIADQDNGAYAYFEDDGSLFIGLKDSVNGDCGVKISCKEVPYKVLLEALKTTSMYIVNNRMKYQDDTSLDFTHDTGRRTLFGIKADNPYNPSNYFSPDQQQSRVIDIKERYYVDSQFFLRSTLAKLETQISYTFTISKFSENAIATV